MLLLKEDGSRKHYRYFWVAAVSRELHWAPSEKPGASGKVERLQSQRTSDLFCVCLVRLCNLDRECGLVLMSGVEGSVMTCRIKEEKHRDRMLTIRTEHTEVRLRFSTSDSCNSS